MTIENIPNSKSNSLYLNSNIELPKTKFLNLNSNTSSDNRFKKWSPTFSKIKLKFSTSISNWKVNQKIYSEMWSLKMVIMVFQVTIELKNDLPNSQLLSQTAKSIKKCLQKCEVWKWLLWYSKSNTRSVNRIKNCSPKFSTSISNCKVNQKMSLEMWSLKMVIMVFQILLLKTQLLSDISEKSITFGIV